MMKNIYCEKTRGILGSAASVTDLEYGADGLVSHINVFLYDTHSNKNGSVINEEIGDSSIPSFIDLPMIVTETLGHNVYPDNPDVMPEGGVFLLSRPVEEMIQKSRDFEVGRITNVVKKYVASASKKLPKWIAQVKLTDNRFRKFITDLANKYADIRQAKLFVSSFFVGTASAIKDKYIYDGPVRGIHIALVKSPAFDEDVSLISGVCTGSDLKCASDLAAAASYNTDNKLVSDFNNELLQFSKSLYKSGYASSNMTDDNNQKVVDNTKPAVDDKVNEKQEPKDNKEEKTISVKEKEFNELKDTVALLKKKSEEKNKESDQEAEDEEEEEEKEAKKSKTELKLEARVKELERERSIDKWMRKLEPIKSINAKKMAALIVDKGFTEDEAEEYIKSFAPVIKASANSNTQKEKKDDALLTQFTLASASAYDGYDDAEKKTSNKIVNLGAAAFLSNFIKPATN